MSRRLIERRKEIANVKYKYDLSVITREQNGKSGETIQKSERIKIQVDSFEVDGGADRKIAAAENVGALYQSAIALRSLRPEV